MLNKISQIVSGVLARYNGLYKRGACKVGVENDYRSLKDLFDGLYYPDDLIPDDFLEGWDE